eukprot:TRINITY_DN1371_c0_g1_i1.p1 TRINITY_DN1371_c0_g1~~TRINITY_DN1371_c0_g1_i1.p1  ORF type:complete len:286 (+),score=78.62 TRINITY_DN1371_c0_g1_i1:332-1189(+)
MTWQSPVQLESVLSILSSSPSLIPSLPIKESSPHGLPEVSLSTPEVRDEGTTKTSLPSDSSSFLTQFQSFPTSTSFSSMTKEEEGFHLPCNINQLDFLGIRGFGSLAAQQIAVINNSLHRSQTSNEGIKSDGRLLHSILPSFLQMKTNPIKKMRRNRRSKNQKKPETTVAAIWKEVQKLQENQVVQPVNLLDDEGNPAKRQRIEVDLLSDDRGDPEVPNNSPNYPQTTEEEALDGKSEDFSSVPPGFSQLDFDFPPEGDPFLPPEDWINQMFGETFETNSQYTAT